MFKIETESLEAIGIYQMILTTKFNSDFQYINTGTLNFMVRIHNSKEGVLIENLVIESLSISSQSLLTILFN